MVTTVVAAILAIAGNTAVSGADGTNPRLWESGSVLYAEVVNVEHNVGNTYQDRAATNRYAKRKLRPCDPH